MLNQSRRWLFRLALLASLGGGLWLWSRGSTTRAADQHGIEIRPHTVAGDRSPAGSQPPGSNDDYIVIRPGAASVPKPPAKTCPTGLPLPSRVLQGIPKPEELIAPLTRRWGK